MFQIVDNVTQDIGDATFQCSACPEESVCVPDRYVQGQSSNRQEILVIAQ